MAFADRLTNLRKDRQLTQATLAERANTHVTQIRRYEAGTSTPTLHLEAINHLDETDQQTIRSIIEAILLRHDTRRWTNAS